MKKTKRVLSVLMAGILAFSTMGSGQVFAAPEESQSFVLSLDRGYLTEGTPGRIYLEGKEDFAIKSVDYEAPDEKVSIDPKTGTVSIREGYTPVDRETVELKATVTYYDPNDVIFYDDFEGEKKFTDGGEASYRHSETEAHWGRSAGTPVKDKVGPAKHTISSGVGQLGTVTAWFYDTGDTKTSQTKLCFDVNQTGVAGNHAIGVAYDSKVGSNVNYVKRSGNPLVQYGWDDSKVERTKGWHELRWEVTAAGTKAYIDGYEIFDSPLLKSIGWVQLMTNWTNNSDNCDSICDKMFFDDVTVVKPGADANLKTEVISATVMLRELTEYDIPGNTEVILDKNALAAIEIQMTPSVDPDIKITLGETALREGSEYTTEGNKVIISKDYLGSLGTGKHVFQIALMNKTVTFTIVVIDGNAGTDYYFSNNGNDANKGTEASPYASLEKLNSLELQPGDTVYLDAKSIWNGQIKIDDSGLPGMPITITKYNADSRESRPVINAGPVVTKDNRTKPTILTLANQGTNCYAAGALEIRNASYVNVSGLELTNDGGESAKERITGRNGILVIADLPKGTTAATYNAEWKKSAQTSIHIDDCYVHDVNSSPDYKMAGGINFFGNIDDILVENCTTRNCDNEGIRNAGLYNQNNSWPATSKVVFRNNYIDGSTGDGMVISNVLNSTISGNVVTNCGKPELSGAANYAALWLIGAENTVVENNEVFNNPYRCPDGEAFDFDHHCKGSVYQYNYTHDNAGGVLLTMNSVTGRNIFRYNISVDDGGYYNPHLFFGSVPQGKEKGTYIYNNVFMVAPLVEKIFESGNDVYFYNNILMALHGNVPVFAQGSVADGMIKNNIIYPKSLLNGSFGTAEVADNLFVNPLLGGPGTKPEGIMLDALTSGAHLDLSKLEAYKLLGESPAINAGAEVELPSVFAAVGEAKQDFFGNPINGKPDIGVHEWNNDSPELTVPEVLPVSIEIRAEKTEIDPRESIALQAVVAPANAWESTVSWSSSDPDVAVVDAEKGVVTGLSSGTATIRATSQADKKVYDEIEITVKDLGEGVLVGFEIHTESNTVKAGESVNLSVIGVDSKGNKVDLNPENLVVNYQTNVGTVDEKGMLTIPEDASGTVSVSAQVTVMSQADFSESFETETTTFVGGTRSLVRTKERAQDGVWSMKTMNATVDDDAVKTFLEARQGTVSAWFFDTAGVAARKAISVSPDNTLYALGVFKDTKTDTYAYRIDGTSTWRDSKVKRSTGWHEFKWVFSDEGLKVYIDGTYLAQNANVKNYSNIKILSRGGWTESTHDNNFGVDNIRTWIDEKYEAKDLGLTIIPKKHNYYTTSIQVERMPDKQVYLVDEEFEPKGMEVSAVKKASSSDAIKIVDLDLMVLDYEYDFSEPGIKEVTIVYKDMVADQKEETFTTKVKVSVTEEPVEEDSYYTTAIRVDREPEKQVYLVGEEFEPEGMEVLALQKASPSNAERTVELDLEELEYEYDFSEPGTKTVIVKYEGLNADQEEKTFTAKVKVSVTEEPVEEDSYYTTKIQVDKKPDKLVYYVDEEFEPEGMKVSALQKASPSNAVRTVELDPGELEYEYDFTTSGKKKVKIIYYGLDKNQEEKKFTVDLTVKVGIPWTPIEPAKPIRPSQDSGSNSSSTVSVQGTWKQDSVGWYFTYTSGGYAANRWERINNNWYYFNQEGYMVTQWQYIDNNWYYLDPLSGAMVTGWHLDAQDGNWYYLSPVNGAVKVGWQQVGGNWYYLNTEVPEASWKYDAASKQWIYEKKNILPYGAMYQNTTTPDGYQVDSNGAWKK